MTRDRHLASARSAPFFCSISIQPSKAIQLIALHCKSCSQYFAIPIKEFELSSSTGSKEPLNYHLLTVQGLEKNGISIMPRVVPLALIFTEARYKLTSCMHRSVAQNSRHPSYDLLDFDQLESWAHFANKVTYQFEDKKRARG